LLGFFGFFGFFGILRKSGNDERNDKNINRACRNSFAYYVVIAAVSMVYLVSTSVFDAMPLFVALLSQGVTIFGISYTFYTNKGE